MTAYTDESTTGLSIVQEPKYTTNGKAIVNRRSGKEIPVDEPIFVFRARDLHAIPTLEFYLQHLAGEHASCVQVRLNDFRRFKQCNTWKMKIPDTMDGLSVSPPLSWKERLRRRWVVLKWRVGSKGERCLCTFYEAAHYDPMLEWDMEDRPCGRYTP